jgi:hypothetical protein
MSSLLFLKIIPVTPPTVNKNKNPIIQKDTGFHMIFVLIRDATQEKILIPVGTAIIIVAAVKYARLSRSRPTVNIWCAQTTHPRSPILIIA